MWPAKIPTPVQEIFDPLLDKKKIRLFIKREDLIHDLVSGNKWRKLHLNLKKALAENSTAILTYGGAYSNHIDAVAVASKMIGLKSIGIIRGDELNENSNETLARAAKNGMELTFVSRTKYKEYSSKHETPFPMPSDVLILPEGGTNSLAIDGCAQIIDELKISYDIIGTPLGTGGTMMGLVKGLKGKNKIWGFSALKGIANIDPLFESFNIKLKNFEVFDENQFGGYARFNHNLIQFILDFYQKFGVLLDPIYTGKMFFSVWEMIKNDQIARYSTIVLIHTGGLQGITAFNRRYGVSLPTPEVL